MAWKEVDDSRQGKPSDRCVGLVRRRVDVRQHEIDLANTERSEEIFATLS